MPATTNGAVNANERSSAIRIIWDCLLSVVVTQNFITQGIKNAPPVSASNVRFVLSHCNMGRVRHLVEENKLMKSKVSHLDEEMVKLKRSMEGITQIADQTMLKVSEGGRKKGQEGGYWDVTTHSNPA